MVDRFQCSPCGLAESQIVYPVRLFIRTSEVRDSVFGATMLMKSGAMRRVATMESSGQSPAATWANLESEFSASIEPKPDLLLFEESATRFRCLP